MNAHTAITPGIGHNGGPPIAKLTTKQREANRLLAGPARNIMLRVEGLSSAQLPPLSIQDSTGLRRYPDQPQQRNEVNDKGLIGSREESEALVPSQSGRITLPEHICERFGLTDWVCVVGLRERFQIWNREAYYAHSARMREKAREGLAALRAQQRGKAS